MNALLLGACGADAEPSSTADTRTEPETTTVSAQPSPAGGSPSEAISTGALDIIAAPDPGGRLPPELWIGCKYGPEFQVSDLEDIEPLDAGDPGGVAEAIEPFLQSGEGQYWPQSDWLILRETTDEILLVHEDADGLSFMNVSRVNGAWTWSGSRGAGPCPLYYVVPDDLNAVDWRLDPEASPGAADSALRVLIMERECVSGREIGDRLRGPQIVMTDDVVRLAFAAQRPPGDAFDCQGNPETPMTVDLPEPLGDREIIEGLAIGIDLEDYLAEP